MRHNLKVFRVDRNMTQQDMADKFNISVSTYHLIEQGIRRGSMEFWTNFQNEFNLDDATMWRIQKNI